jgi:hypothetical protein
LINCTFFNISNNLNNVIHYKDNKTLSWLLNDNSSFPCWHPCIIIAIIWIEDFILISSYLSDQNTAMKLWVVFLLLVNVFRVVYMRIELENFYPYGPQNGDSAVPRNDDGSSGLVNIGFPFPFFDNDHNSLFVSSYLYNERDKLMERLLSPSTLENC